MKKIFVFLFILILPLKVLAIETSASSAILMDTDTKRIIYSKNINDHAGTAAWKCRCSSR